MPSASFHDLPLAISQRWEKANFNRHRGSYGLREDCAGSVISNISAEDTDLQSEYAESLCSDYSATSYTCIASTEKSIRFSCLKSACASSVAPVDSNVTRPGSAYHFHLNDMSNKPKRSKRQSVISSKSGRIMSLLLIVGVAAFASFMYNVPIMQKVEIKSLQESLNRNVYCQQHAVDELMRHIRQYTAMEWKGLVLLVLAGPEGCGKTHTINTMAEVNPSWTKIVVTHEQGSLNKLGEEEFISNIRRKIHSSRLNFIFVDDAQPLREGTPFVEMKLKPLLASLKLENTLIFVVVTMLSKDDKVVLRPS